MKIAIGIFLYLLAGYFWGKYFHFSGIVDIVLFPVSILVALCRKKK